MADLFAWVKREPVCAQLLGDLELRASADGGAGGLGVFSRAAAAPGDVLLRVPLSGCFTLANARMRDDEATMAALASLARHGPQCKLAAMVALEIERDSHKEWIDCWPRPIEGSLGWAADGAEWRRLAAGLGEGGVRALHEQHSTMAARAWADAFEPLGSPSRERWTYALSMVLSRALDLRVNDESQLAIVPLVDMLNHTRSEADSCHLRFNTEAQAFELLASAPIQPNDELRICYGRKGNAELLACYGFALPDNEVDRLVLQLPFGAPDEPPMVTMHKMAMLPSQVIKALNLRQAETGGGRVAQLEAHWEDAVESGDKSAKSRGRQEAALAEEMVLLLRLSALGAEDLPAIALAFEGQPVSVDAEARAWEQLRSLCAEAEARVGPLGAADETPLAGDDAITVLEGGLRELAAATHRLALRRAAAPASSNAAL